MPAAAPYEHPAANWLRKQAKSITLTTGGAVEWSGADEWVNGRRAERGPEVLSNSQSGAGVMNPRAELGGAVRTLVVTSRVATRRTVTKRQRTDPRAIEGTVGAGVDSTPTRRRDPMCVLFVRTSLVLVGLALWSCWAGDATRPAAVAPSPTAAHSVAANPRGEPIESATGTGRSGAWPATRGIP